MPEASLTTNSVGHPNRRGRPRYNLPQEEIVDDNQLSTRLLLVGLILDDELSNPGFITAGAKILEKCVADIPGDVPIR